MPEKGHQDISEFINTSKVLETVKSNLLDSLSSEQIEDAINKIGADQIKLIISQVKNKNLAYLHIERAIRTEASKLNN